MGKLQAPGDGLLVIKTKVITLVNHKGHRQCSEPIKTKVTTLANHKRHRQYSEPIKTQTKRM